MKWDVIRYTRSVAGVMVMAGMAATAGAQPTNDMCGGAALVPALPFTDNPAVGNTATDTNDLPAADGCYEGLAFRGIWYTYIPTQGTSTTVTFSITGTGLEDFVNGGEFIQILRNTNGTCTSLVAGAECVLEVDNTVAATSIFSALPGNTYFITVGPLFADVNFPADAVYHISIDGVPLPSGPGNDNCSGAASLSATASSWTVNTGGAGDDTSTSSCGSNVGRGVWYRFDSTFQGRATFSFENVTGISVDPGKIISAYAGTCNGTLAPALNANVPSSPGFNTSCETSSGQATPARLTIDVQPGVSYYFLAGITTSGLPTTTSYALSFEAVAAPSNDTCAAATVISSLPYAPSSPVRVGGATDSVLPQTAQFSCVQSIADIWYTYVPSVDQLVKVEWSGASQTDNNGFGGGGTGVYSGSCGNLQPVACSDGTAAAQFALRAGTTYYFMMGRKYPANFAFVDFYTTDTYQFAISSIGTPPSAPLNDRCAQAQALSTFPFSQTINVTGAADGIAQVCFSYPNGFPGPEVWVGDVWYSYVPPVNQFVSVEPQTDRNFSIVFYSGTCDNLTPLGCDVIDPGRLLTAGTQYFIQIGGGTSLRWAATPTLPFTIRIIPPSANDLCGNAKNVGPLPYIDSSDIALATDDASGASCTAIGQSAIHRGVWYSYTQPSNGPVFQPMAVWNSRGPAFRSAISVFDGGCSGFSIGCGDSGSSMFFDADAGQTYKVLVGDYDNNISNTESGPYSSMIEFHLAIPTGNSSCNAAYQITSFPFHAAADNTLPNQITTPTLCGSATTLYRAIYLTFTPSQSGNMTLNLATNSSNAVLMYSGPCNNLNPVLCSIQGGTFSSGNGVRSHLNKQVTASVTAGTRYTLVLGNTFSSESNVTGFNLIDLNIASACPADFNNSGTVTDIFGFLSAWFAGNPNADVNHSGTVTMNDIFFFLSRWFAGC